MKEGKNWESIPEDLVRGVVKDVEGEKEEKSGDKIIELDRLEYELEKLENDFAILKDKKVEGKENIEKKKKQKKELKRDITQAKNAINVLRGNSPEFVSDEEIEESEIKEKVKEEDKTVAEKEPTTETEIKNEEEYQPTPELIKEAIAEKKGREELEEKLLQVDELLSLYRNRGRFLFHLENLKSGNANENEIANAQTKISEINYKIKGLYREITRSDIKGFPENEKRKIEEIMVAVEEGKMDYGKLAIREDKEKEDSEAEKWNKLEQWMKEKLKERIENLDDIENRIRYYRLLIEENNFDGEEELKEEIEKRGLDSENKEHIKRAFEIIIELLENELKELKIEPETPESEPEIETEKEPRTIGEIIDILGSFENYEMFKEIYEEKRKRKAEMRRELNRKEKDGEEISKEERKEYDNILEEEQRAKIDVDNEEIGALYLITPRSEEMEDWIIKRKLELTELLKKNYEILGKMKGEEERKFKELSSEEREAAGGFCSNVVNKGLETFKRFTNKDSSQQTEEPEKVGRLRGLRNLVEKKLFGNSTESEKDRFKKIVVLEFLGVIGKGGLEEALKDKGLKDGGYIRFEDEDVKVIAKRLFDKNEGSRNDLEEEIRELKFWRSDFEGLVRKSEKKIDLDEGVVDNVGDPLSSETGLNREIKELISEEGHDIGKAENIRDLTELLVSLLRYTSVVPLGGRPDGIASVDWGINSYLRSIHNATELSDLFLEMRDSAKNVEPQELRKYYEKLIDKIEEIENKDNDEEDTIEDEKKDEDKTESKTADDYYKKAQRIAEKLTKDIESKIEIGIGKMSDDEVREFQKDFEDNLVDDRNVLYERRVRIFEEIGIDYNDIKEMDANWLIETLKETCDEKIKKSKDTGDEKKEIGEITEEMKENIREELERIKFEDKKSFENIKILINSYSNSKRLFGEDFLKTQFDGFSKGEMDLEFEKIKSCKTKDFIKVLEEVYEKVKGEEDIKTDIEKKEIMGMKEEIKSAIKKELKKMNKEELKSIKLNIGAFFSGNIDETLKVSDTSFLHEYPKTSTMIVAILDHSEIEHGDIENIKVKEFVKEFNKICDEIKKEK